MNPFHPQSKNFDNAISFGKGTEEVRAKIIAAARIRTDDVSESVRKVAQKILKTEDQKVARQKQMTVAPEGGVLVVVDGLFALDLATAGQISQRLTALTGKPISVNGHNQSVAFRIEGYSDAGKLGESIKFGEGKSSGIS